MSNDSSDPVTDGVSARDAVPGSAREWFEAALARPASARVAWLAAQCSDAALRAEVERLLAADSDETQLLDQPLAALLGRVDAQQRCSALPAAGTRLGGFELGELIGQGGSSLVFRATREHDGVRQQVALKLLRWLLPSAEEQRRFRAERQALAQLRHPGIARLIEGGVADNGLPYIALELVEGEYITDYVRRQHSDLHTRLRLVIAVCRAVGAAHRALIVHRDLKPSNVLVTAEGEVKLLDFGIAKLLDAAADETHTLYRAMTPAYAAPEQFSGAPVTTATDVYALGILLGELITGVRVNDGGGDTPSARVDATSEPGVLPVSAALLRRQLRGDLDNIVAKAAAAEPERRYASAGALADDLERHLDGRPVQAHPPSRWYRARKFVQRHRGGVAVSAALLLAVLSALGVALWQASLARGQAQRADAMRGFIVDAFAEAIPTSPREKSPSIAEVAQQAVRRLRHETHMNPPVRIELQGQLGRVLLRQGEVAAAGELLRENLAEARALLGADDAVAVQVGALYLDYLTMSGDFTAARSLVDDLLAHASPRPSALRAELLAASGRIAANQLEMPRALREAEAAVALALGLGDAKSLDIVLMQQALVQLRADQNAAAGATLQRLLDSRQRKYGRRDERVAAVHLQLVRVYDHQDDYTAAETHAREALEINKSVLPADHWRLGQNYVLLMNALVGQRDLAGAELAATDALRIYRMAYGQDPPVADRANDLGMIRLFREDYAAAVPLLRESLAIVTQHFDPGFAKEAGVGRANLGYALVMAGERAEGKALLQRAREIFAADPKADADDLVLVLEKSFRVAMAEGDLPAAEGFVAAIDAALPALSGGSGYWDGRAAALRGALLLRQGKLADARAVLAGAAAALARSAHPHPELQAEIPLLQAAAARQAGDAAAAQAFARAGRERFAVLRYPASRVVQLQQAEAPR